MGGGEPRAAGQRVKTLFDEKRLVRLMDDLYLLTGLSADILDLQGRETRPLRDRPAFCRMIRTLPEGRRRCEECGGTMAEQCAAGEGTSFYRCHAGLRAAVMPLRDQGRLLACLRFCACLDDGPAAQQWRETREMLEWYPGGPDQLEGAFFQLRQYGRQALDACGEILEALAAGARQEGTDPAVRETDLQRLERYLDEHYMEKLSLASVSQQLHIGRTRLCILAKRLSGGHTLSALIARRRIAAAKRLLTQTRMPVSAISEAVGISDYNYFSKVFRSAVGVTPSAFRKAGGEGPGPCQEKSAKPPV